MTLPYIPNTQADRQAMLAAIGVASVEELFADIPAEFRIGELGLPSALSEPELVRELSALAGRNQGQTPAHFLLVGRVDFVGQSQVDAHRHAGLRDRVGDLLLGFAQPRKSGLRPRWPLAEVHQLHDQ
jgi:hypothetical protein